MLRRLFFIMFAAVAGLSAMGADPLTDRFNDTLATSNKIVFIDGRPAPDEMQRQIDSIRREISVFYYDQFRHFQDPGAPYFLFMSKDAQLAMGIGGCVRMRGYFDWGGAIPSPGFAPMLIPMTPNPAQSKHFDTTPAGSTLFFRVLGRNKALGDYQLYLELNFNGYQRRDLHLKKAYAIINDFTVGYAESTFSDPAAMPPTVDAQGPNNKMSPSAVLVRYMPVIKDRWVLAVSAETPQEPAIGLDAKDVEKAYNWMPDWAAFLQYEWARGQHVRLSGIVRTLPYRDILAGTNRNPAGWGVQFSSVAHPLAPLTTYVTVNYGHGVAGLGGDLLMGNYDLVADPSTPGRLYAPASYGWCLGLQYNIRPNLFVSASASQARYLPSSAVSPDEYRYGLFADVNVFWNLTPRIQVGAEFDWGLRANFSGAHRSARRVGALCQFSF